MNTKLFKMKNITFFNILFILIVLSHTYAFSKENKFAVFVGIGKYSNKSHVLLSSTNDATEMCKTYSDKCGKGNTQLILDKKATRENILEGISSYLKDAKEGDLFVFYYSGHGTLFPDRLSTTIDEELTTSLTIQNITAIGQIQLTKLEEKYDTALIPIDAAKKTSKRNWRNLILDDELFEHFAKYTRKGVRVVFISDSCYSGGQSKNLNPIPDEHSKLGKKKFVDWKEAIGIKDENELDSEIIEQVEFFKVDPNFKELYILLASSSNDEPSYSSSPNKKSKMSLFTYYFLNTLSQYKKSNSKFTFEVVNTSVKKKVIKYANRYETNQTPKVITDYYSGKLNISVF